MSCRHGAGGTSGAVIQKAALPLLNHTVGKRGKRRKYQFTNPLRRDDDNTLPEKIREGKCLAISQLRGNCCWLIGPGRAVSGGLYRASRQEGNVGRQHRQAEQDVPGGDDDRQPDDQREPQ